MSQKLHETEQNSGQKLVLRQRKESAITFFLWCTTWNRSWDALGIKILLLFNIWWSMTSMRTNVDLYVVNFLWGNQISIFVFLSLSPNKTRVWAIFKHRHTHSDQIIKWNWKNMLRLVLLFTILALTAGLPTQKVLIYLKQRNPTVSKRQTGWTLNSIGYNGGMSKWKIITVG